MPLITGRNRAQEAAAQRVLLLRISQRYERTIAREIARAMRDYWNSRNKPLGEINAQERHKEKIASILTRLYNESGRAFTNNVFELAKSLGKVREYKQFTEIVPPTMMDSIVANYIRENLRVKDDQIVSTTTRNVADIVARGVTDGLGEREIGRLIQGAAPSIGASRAQTIARTETHGAGQAISLEAPLIASSSLPLY